MKRETRPITVFLCCWFVVAMVVQARAQPCNPACGSYGPGYPEICVCFDNLQDAPVEDFDFRFDVTSDPDSPSVVLLRGRNEAGGLYLWHVWSWDKEHTPANIGSITAPGEYDYDVSIWHGDPSMDGRGALNVGVIDLTPGGSPGDHYSSLSGGGPWTHIAGDLTTRLVAVADASGAGGELHMVIDGNASADIDVYRIENTVYIGGTASDNIHVDLIHDYAYFGIASGVSGNIEIDTLQDSAWLLVDSGLSGTIEIEHLHDLARFRIWSGVTGTINVGEMRGPVGDPFSPLLALEPGGDLSGTGSITVGSMRHAVLNVYSNVLAGAQVTVSEFIGDSEDDQSTVTFGLFPDTVMEGRCFFPGGISEFGNVILGYSEFLDPGQIDLNYAGVDGVLNIWPSGDAAIVNGGDLTGVVNLGMYEDAVYSGTATFAGVGLPRVPGPPGKIAAQTLAGTIALTAQLDGAIEVSTVVGGGQILIGTDVESSSVIDIENEMAGLIDIGASIKEDAAILVGGSISGQVVVGSDMDGSILAVDHISGGSAQSPRIDIGGEVYCGTIRADANEDGTGDLTGWVDIFGVFNGEICGYDLSAGLLPGTIDLQKPGT